MEIKHLKLGSYHFKEQWDFYTNILHLNCHKLSREAFRVTTMHTHLEFHKSDHKQIYHFAFLVPSARLDEAMQYLETRGVELLLLDGEKIVHFNPGRAVYFKDKDGNIVEWIERPSVVESVGLNFHPSNLISINEIGFPVSNPRSTAHSLVENYGIIPANPEGFSDDFCWVGDARGVLIVVKKGRNWLPTEIPSVYNFFEIQYASGQQVYHLNIKGDEIVSVANGD